MLVHKDQIRAVIFDWGGVCCAEAEPFASIPLQRKLQLTPNEIAAQIPTIYFDYYRGKYRRDSFWNAVLQYFRIMPDDELNPEKLSAAYLGSYSIYPKVFQRVTKLKEMYQLALLSNLTPEMRDHIRASHMLDRYFDIQVYSCDDDVREIKPERKPYEVALNKLHLNATDCLFIDNSAKNLVSAEAMGMQTLLFQNVEQFLLDTNAL